MKSEQFWLNSMKGEDGQFSERVLSDDCERFFWKNFLNNERNTRKDEYSKVVEKEVFALLQKYNLENLLEIGPGWGNYTFSLAKYCKELFCLDISEDVLCFIRQKAKSEGIDNIHTFQTKWEDADYKSYDAIFAYNCFYRMREISEALRKIDDCTRKIAIVGMNSKIDRPCMLEIEKELGLTVRKSRLNHHMIYDVLCEMGIKAQKLELEVYREYVFDDLQQAVAYEKRFILDEDYNEEDLYPIVSKQYHFVEGKYRQSHYICAGLVFWEKLK